MLLDSFLILAGILGLYFGAVYLVRGSVVLARIAGMSPFAVACTVVAFGTSTPELLVTFVATLQGSPDVAMGNIIGSNIVNLALILSLSYLFVILPVPESLLARDYPVLLLLTGVLYLQAFDGVIGRFDGTILFLVCAAYLHHVLTSKVGTDGKLVEAMPFYPLTRSLLMTLGGLAAVLVGAKLLVDSGVAVARAVGVREIVIGLTLVAVGSSLPELATSLVAAVRGEHDISVGNVIGSNIINIGIVLGLVAMIKPVPVPGGATSFEFPAMLGFTAIPFLLIRKHRTILRWHAVGIIALYALFITALPFVRGAGR